MGLLARFIVIGAVELVYFAFKIILAYCDRFREKLYKLIALKKIKSTYMVN